MQQAVIAAVADIVVAAAGGVNLTDLRPVKTWRGNLRIDSPPL